MKVVTVRITASDKTHPAVEDLQKAAALVKASGPVLTEESISLMASATSALNRLSLELGAGEDVELTAAPGKKIKMSPSMKRANLKKAKKRMAAVYAPGGFKEKTFDQLNDLCGDHTYDETEIDGHPIGYWVDSKGNVIGMWYNQAKVGSYNPKVNGDGTDPVTFTEADPNWPYEA